MVDWEQVNAWRVQQHSLHERAAHSQMLDVIKQIGGLHAQVMSAAELQVWARVQDILPGHVQDALWNKRTLVKTWAMRGTLHLIPTSEFPLLVAVLSTLKHFKRSSWQKYFGVTLTELEAIIEGVRGTLTDVGTTREQLADEIASQTNMPKLRELLRSGWGAILKPVAFQGLLCFGPNQGQNVTFVQPKAWIGEWTPLDPQAAMKEFARRFLNTYGPATTDEFARWVGLEPSDSKKAFKALGDEIAEVNVEGWKSWVLASSLKQMEMLKPVRSVRLLPLFDLYTIAVARHSQYLLDEKYKGRVYRPQGWISAVVLVDGRIEGVWEYEQKRSQTTVKVAMFGKPSGDVQQGIEREIEQLGRFLESDVKSEIVVSS